VLVFFQGHLYSVNGGDGILVMSSFCRKS
jgi:hypothetical protein